MIHLLGQMDEDTFSFAAQQEFRSAKEPAFLEVRMTVAVPRPAVKILLIAAGVLLGLLALVLMVLPEVHASHGVLLGARKLFYLAYFGKLHPMGVLWH